MEKRLIDANNAISVLKILSDKCRDDNVFKQAISVLESVPTVDALSVVRCKDCRWGKEAHGFIECTVDEWAEYHDHEWFCPLGERR